MGGGRGGLLLDGPSPDDVWDVCWEWVSKGLFALSSSLWWCGNNPYASFGEEITLY